MWPRSSGAALAAGIDAPESKQTCVVNGFGWACGGEATRSLSAMLDSGPVRCEGNKRDRYDRLIATCWAGARSVNAEMVRGGWALAYRKYSLAYVEEEAEARAAGRGVWRGQFVEPWEHRQSQRLAQADRSHEQR